LGPSSGDFWWPLLLTLLPRGPLLLALITREAMKRSWSATQVHEASLSEHPAIVSATRSTDASGTAFVRSSLIFSSLLSEMLIGW
jgi:hypothetical protein